MVSPLPRFRIYLGTSMVYVDLNPIRTDICKTLEDSEYTSIKQRIEQVTETVKLSPFIGSSLKADGIAFALKDYLELADWTGRIVREDKRGFIDTSTPSILQKLQLDEQTWMETVHGYSKGFHCFVGTEEQLKALCQKQKRHWVRGINACRKLFKSNIPLPVTT